MALSLLINVDSSPDACQLGTLQLSNERTDDKGTSSASEKETSDNNKKLPEKQTREVRITFTGCEDVYR